MHFPYWIIKIILLLRKPFSSKEYRVRLINRVVLVYRANPEIVIQDYSNYVLDLLVSSLQDVKTKKVIFYECPGLTFLKLLFQFKTIYLQIEHTLFWPGSSTSSNRLQAQLPVSGMNENYLIRISEYDKLFSANIIFDYSRINLLNIRSAPSLEPIFKNFFCISPALYSLYTNSQNRSGVITLFGNPEISRRKYFLNLLRDKGIEYKNVRGVYSGVDNIYRRAKIVINIRQTDEFHTLEELRVLPALRSGAIVVCENAPYIEKTAYSQFVIWGSLEEIPNLVVEVEKHYETVHRRIFGDGSENSPFAKRMRRIEKCNQLAVKKALNLIDN